MWNNVKRKNRRPLSSIVLEDGVVEAIVQDARDFIDSEGWYLQAGIPHRRGYLLHGPPGTGKSSTIYALAGELGVEIYSISLASKL
jgi:chaperone BCS1